jgi:hypothetical protein
MENRITEQHHPQITFTPLGKRHRCQSHVYTISLPVHESKFKVRYWQYRFCLLGTKGERRATRFSGICDLNPPEGKRTTPYPFFKTRSNTSWYKHTGRESPLWIVKTRHHTKKGSYDPVASIRNDESYIKNWRDHNRNEPYVVRYMCFPLPWTNWESTTLMDRQDEIRVKILVAEQDIYHMMEIQHRCLEIRVDCEQDTLLTRIKSLGFPVNDSITHASPTPSEKMPVYTFECDTRSAMIYNCNRV